MQRSVVTSVGVRDQSTHLSWNKQVRCARNKRQTPCINVYWYSYVRHVGIYTAHLLCYVITVYVYTLHVYAVIVVRNRIYY